MHRLLRIQTTIVNVFISQHARTWQKYKLHITTNIIVESLCRTIRPTSGAGSGGAAEAPATPTVTEGGGGQPQPWSDALGLFQFSASA